MKEQRRSIREDVNEIEAIDFLTYPSTDVARKKYLEFALPALMDEMGENAKRGGSQSMAEIYTKTSKLLRDKEIGIRVEGYLTEPINEPAKAVRIEKHSQTDRSIMSLEVVLKIGLWYDLWHRGRLSALHVPMYDLATNLVSEVSASKSAGSFVPYKEMPKAA